MRRILISAAAMATLFGAGAAIADTPPANKPTTTAAEPGSGGAIRAYVDPLTGELLQGPPPGLRLRPLQPPGLVPDDSRLEFLEAADGTHGVLFHGQRQATMTATLDADGSVRTHCVESTANLDAAPAPPADGDGHEPHP